MTNHLLQVSTLNSEYIHSLLVFLINNKWIFSSAMQAVAIEAESQSKKRTEEQHEIKFIRNASIQHWTK